MRVIQKKKNSCRAQIVVGSSFIGFDRFGRRKYIGGCYLFYGFSRKQLS